jgi:hypothetical protein
MLADYTDMTVVLDRSGSMADIKSDMEGGFDTLIAEQKKQPGRLDVTLWQFDDQIEKVYEGRDVSDVPKLSLIPRGSTALLDCIGAAIDATGLRLSKMAEQNRPANVLFLIITDGEENASKKFKRDTIKEMIEHQTHKYKWVFSYLGADVNSFAEARSIGISDDTTMDFSKSKSRETLTCGSLALSAMRGGHGYGYSDQMRKMSK